MSSSEPAFVAEFQRLAEHGGEQELYHRILATLKGLADSILERSAEPNAATYLAHASQLLQSNYAAGGAQSSKDGHDVLLHLLCIVKHAFNEVTPGMQLRVAPDLATGLFRIADGLSNGGTDGNAASNAEMMTVVDGRVLDQQQVGPILKHVFDILAAVVAASPASTQKETLDFCWRYALGSDSSSSAPSPTASSDGASSSGVSVQVAKRAQQVILAKLQASLACGSPSTSAFLVQRVRKVIAESIPRALEEQVVAATKTTGMNQKQRLAAQQAQQAAHSADHDLFHTNRLRHLIPFATKCLYSISKVEHVRDLSGYMLDVAGRFQMLAPQVYQTYFRALYKEVIVPLAPIASRGLNSPPGGGDRHLPEPDGTTATGRKLMFDGLQQRLLKLSATAGVALPWNNRNTGAVEHQEHLAIVKVLTWCQLAAFELRAELGGLDLLSVARTLILDFGADNDPVAVQCLLDVIQGIPDLDTWAAVAAILQQVLTGGASQATTGRTPQEALPSRSAKSSTSRPGGGTNNSVSFSSAEGMIDGAGLHSVHLILAAAAFRRAEQLKLEDNTVNFVGCADVRVDALVKAVAALYDGIPETQFRNLADEFHECLKRAANAVGPETLLEMLPLRLLEADLTAADYARRSRGFLLTVLANFDSEVAPVRLEFFRTKLLPLADQLEQKGQAAEKQNRHLLAKECRNLSLKVWALAPGFFLRAHDFATAFLKEGGALAKRICFSLMQRPELRDTCSRCLKNVCTSTFADEHRENDRKVLSNLAPKIVPEMFQCFLQIPKDLALDVSARARSACLLGSAIDAYARCLRPESVAKLFGEAAERMIRTNQELGKVAAAIAETNGEAAPPGQLAGLVAKKTLLENELGHVCELAAILTPSLPKDKLETALRAFEVILGVEGGVQGGGRKAACAAQKACYKGVKNVFEHEQVEEVNAEMLEKLWDILKKTRTATEEGAYKARMKALLSFLGMVLGDEEEDSDSDGGDDSDTEEDGDSDPDADDGSDDDDEKAAKGACAKTSMVEPALRFNFLKQQLLGEQGGFLVSDLLKFAQSKNRQVRTLAESGLFRVFRACLVSSSRQQDEQMGDGAPVDLAMPLIGALGADLTSQNPGSKARSVEALAKLLYEHADDMDEEVLEQVCEVVLILLRDRDRQVFKAVLKFAKVMCWVVPVGVLKRRTVFYQDGRNKAEGALTSSFLHDLYANPNSESCNLLKRRIVEKLLKRLCYMGADGDDDEDDEEEEVDLEIFRKSFPFKHLPQLEYVLKGLERRVRKSLQEKTQRREEQVKKSYASFFKDADGDADEEKSGAKQLSKKELKEARKREMAAEDAGNGGAAKKKRRSGEMMDGEDGDALTTMLDEWEGDDDGFESGNRKRARRLHKNSIFDAPADSIFRKKLGLGDSSLGGKDGVLELSDIRNLAHSLLSSDKGIQLGTAAAADKKMSDRRAAKPAKKQGGEEEEDERGVSFRQDGKMVVEEEPSDGDDDDDGTAKPSAKAKLGLGVLKAQREKKLLQKLVRKKDKKGHTVRGVTHYAPTKGKARGDAKPRGAQHEPYAYVALNPRLQKEKFKQKSVNTFKAVTGKTPERGAKAKKLQVKKKGNKARNKKGGKKGKK